MTATLEIVPSVLDRIRRALVGLKMPRALEVLDQTVRQLERGETSALEVCQDACRLRLLVPALTRQKPNSGARAARLYQWQRGDPLPWSTRNRKEPPRHRARRRGGKGRPRRLLLKPCRHCRHSRQGRAGRAITERNEFLCRPSLLIVDEIGYLPVIPGGGNLFFQLSMPAMSAAL